MKHYNPSITERANRIFNLKNGEQMSEDVDGPVAVISLIPTLKILRTISLTNSLTSTVFTTPTDRDFYLVAGLLQVSKDATATATDIRLNVTIDGAVQPICRIRGFTLTALSETQVLSLPFPIKVDRGTTITITSDTNVANINGTATIIGYYEEVTRT